MGLNAILKPLEKNKCLALFAGVLIINLVQSRFCQLLNDEPYYWLYAQYPSWGYFDHPPMIAFLIRMGTALFGGELGVRLFPAILGSLTFCLIYKIIAGETQRLLDFRLILLLLLSSLFLNLYSFLAIPDTPMLFFAALFLYTYRRYLNDASVLSCLLLGLVTALLLYSKYHGLLLVGFTVLSNLKMVLKRSFYVVFLMALVLYIPHIYWEYQHDYPTIRFQFMERVNDFDIKHVFSYLGEQALVTGPVVLLLVAMLYKPQNQFQKSLKYIVAGIFLFFLVSSFKEMVNVHWTAIALPAMLCLAYLYIEQLTRYRGVINGLLVFNLVAVVVFRINFIGNFFKLSNFNDKNPALMTQMLKAKAGDIPLVFEDVYNEPSDFRFYSGDKCFAVNGVEFKKTQYNYLPSLERSFQGKTVYYVSGGPIDSTSKMVSVPRGGKYYLTLMSDFTSCNTSVKVNVLNIGDIKASVDNTIRVSVESQLSEEERKTFNVKGGSLVLSLINNTNNKSYHFTYGGKFDVSESKPLEFKFKAPAEPGSYKCVFSVVIKGQQQLGFNSSIYNQKIVTAY